ncbi:MAG: ATP-dependent zinc metalloprotease FtsH [Bacteroidaceae bacterium]|nr:ATP-dependent zinc metalloprotease FtsH [Bacteroidaceae bacterium]
MNDNKNNHKKINPNKNKKQGPQINLTWIYLIIAVTLGYLLLSGDSTLLSGASSRNANYSEFKSYVEQGYASRIIVNKKDGSLQMYVEPSHIRDVFKEQKVDSGTRPFVVVQVPSADKLEDFISEQQALENFKGEIEYRQGEDDFMHFFWSFGPLILIVFFWIYLMRRMSGGSDGGGPMGIFNVGKSRAKLFEKNDDNKVTFADVAGQEGAKLEVQEIVEFLKNPKRYTDLGGKIPKGALLVGPPGTGKTLLAKAVAGEADVPFFSMSGSDFVEMFVGVGASRVRDLFRQAKEKAPCIIFIDEIDAVGRARSRGVQMGANDERESTLNQLLTEMDGFGTNSGVIIMAATNRADILDKALLRAGRFDRQIHVELPDVSERKAIFQVHLKPIKTDTSLDIDFLARQTPGFSGADIANVCNEAALIAARNGKTAVDKDDFLAAVDRIIGGLEKKNKVMTAEEKRTIALHEAGHATISWLLRYANPLVKVTIVPRGRALGAAWYLPEERQITTREQMLDEMCATLGGRAAEELFCGQISSGAMNDLERVTKQAYSMITYMGMSDKLPNLCYYDNQEYGFQRPYSEATAQLIDEETKAMIAEQYARAKDILSKNAEGHAALAQLLVDREVIFAEDVERIFGPRPWASRTDELLADEAPDHSQPPHEGEENKERQETE